MKAKIRWLSALLAMITLLSGCLCASAEGTPGLDVDLLIAQEVAARLSLRDRDGNHMTVRKDPELKSRGVRQKGDPEPDYVGVLGYVALQADWEVTRFNTFTQTPWQLPFYKKKKDGSFVVKSAINHKTPVLVFEQETVEGLGYVLYGYLKVIRLDTGEAGWIDVGQFVTLPYWTLPLEEAYKYGFCIAAYRERSRYLPIDRKGRRGPLPDDIRVLICDQTTSFRIPSRDRANNPVLGIIFRNKQGSQSYYRTFLRFNEEDLSLVY